jgi:hypothetical protein
MAEYKDIKGFKVQTVSTDPAASIVATGTWASGTSYPQTQQDFAGAGTPTAAVAWGGEIPPRQVTASYDGTSWTTGGNYPTLIVLQAGFGTQTAALSAGGFVSGSPGSTNASNIYNGSTWTAIPNMNTTRSAVTGTGTSTSGLIWGGDLRPGSTSATEEYDGVSWTSSGNLATAVRETAQHIGTQTAAMSASGLTPPGTGTVTDVQIYNGSSWSVSPSTLNTPRGRSGGSGTTTSSLVFGGINPPESPGVYGQTEFYDGTSWTELNNLSTARNGLAGAGTSSSSALAVGGIGTAAVDITEEWTVAPPATFQQENLGQVFYNSTSNAFKVTQQSIPAGTWSSGGSLNTARVRFGGASQGTQNAGLVFGSDSPTYGQTEEYNGTTWSEQNDLNTGRYISYGGAGTQTACVTAGGYNPAGSPAFNTVVSETYNGTSWTEGNDLNTGRIDCSTFGTSTAGVLVGGGTGPGGPNTVTNVEIYNGTSWTETTDIPTATQEMGSLGTGTAGLIFGGSVDDNPTTKNTTFEWDGTSWTSGGNYPIYIKYTTGFGSLTNGIGAGGNDQTGAISGVCNVYNGTSWSEIAELTTARLGPSGNGTASAGFVAGGETTVAVTTTEEWNVPTANYTLTAS